MKKLVSLILAAIMLLVSFAAVAEEIPEGYPEIIPGLDFGGKTVHIYDWYSSGTRAEQPTEEQQMQYDYWDWLQETYNVVFDENTLAGWDAMPGELANIVTAGDASELMIVGIGGGFAGPVLSNNLYMPWTYGLENFNGATEDFMTKNGVCYGVSGGKYIEPRQVVFFNKKVLEAANIDWEELYDLQANMEWTWDKFEEYMDKVLENADTDNNGEADLYALTGNGDDVTIALVVSNEADFFGFDADGKLIVTIDTPEMKDALQRRIDWGTKYMRPNENWDDYMKFWPEGNCAFIIGQSYEGFNGNSNVNACEDPWGCVAIPMGPNAQRYTSAADNNVFGIPAIYDEETSLKLQQIYTLYRQNPLSDEDSWSIPYYALTDDRAVDETYAMLREGENATIMKFNYIGDRNSSVTEILWHMGDGTPEQIIEGAVDAFQGRCDDFNGN